MQDALGRDLAAGEAVDHDAAPGIILAAAQRVGNRADAGVDAAAVAAESQAGKKRLLCSRFVRASGKSATAPVWVSSTASDCSFWDSTVP